MGKRARRRWLGRAADLITIYQFLLLLLGGGTLLGVWARLSGATEFQRGALYGAALGILFATLWLALAVWRAGAKAKARDAATVLVDHSLVNQLRMYFDYCRPAVRIAVDFLDAGVCQTEPGQNDCREVVCRLAQEHCVSPTRRALDLLEGRMKEIERRPSASDFEIAKAQLRELMAFKYPAVARAITAAGGEALRGDKASTQPGYYLLHKYHRVLVEEARRHRSVPDWGETIPDATALDQLFERPQYAGHRFPLEMTPRELLLHVKSGLFRQEFAGRQWAVRVDRPTIGFTSNGLLTVRGHREDGLQVLAMAAHLTAGAEEQLRSAEWVVVSGELRSVTPAMVELVPAKVDDWNNRK